MKTSFPKEDIRVLLLEGVSQSAVDTFRNAGYTQIDRSTISATSFKVIPQ